jgi:starch synthase
MDVLARALEDLLVQERFQFAILGSGEDWVVQRFQALKNMYPDRIGVWWGHDERLAHLFEAGLDIFLMPSRYEPCGLNQMYSLKYGTIPVVRATGGLDDTIVQWDEAAGEGNGFNSAISTRRCWAARSSRCFTPMPAAENGVRCSATR